MLSTTSRTSKIQMFVAYPLASMNTASQLAFFSLSATLLAIFMTSREPAHLPTVSGLLVFRMRANASRRKKPQLLRRMTLVLCSWVEIVSCKARPSRTIISMATSKRTASQAGKDLRNPKTPKRDRGPIASDLAQAKEKKK